MSQESNFTAGDRRGGEMGSGEGVRGMEKGGREKEGCGHIRDSSHLETTGQGSGGHSETASKMKLFWP
jgi:hypothetical protein